MRFAVARTFQEWREHARQLIAENVPPDQIQWTARPDQPTLFDDSTEGSSMSRNPVAFTVPQSFLNVAQHVACHRDEARWNLLYRTLWRLLHGERRLMELSTDDDVHQMMQMQKSVTRDAHKMKAFVRFRKVAQSDGPVQGEGPENFIAWHRPDHRIVRLTAPFFSRRFKGMNWSILTPDESVTWDQQALTYGPGVPASEAPDGDALEELWKTYYASIFNPARVKVAMMKREMPVRHWATLPEASLIDDLLHQAPARVDAMVKKSEGFAETAAHYIPDSYDLNVLKNLATGCRACDLYCHATQTVFGEGPSNARIVMVGEQPGDFEDREGHPFVGPSGKLLDEALQEAGVDRSEVYITNVVKHFKFTETTTTRGKHRLHKKPDSREIYACRPWLEAELAVIQPEVVVCLGATPAQALFGRDFRVTKDRGKIIASDWCQRTMATWHPAAILRMPHADRRSEMRSQLVEDLKNC